MINIFIKRYLFFWYLKIKLTFLIYTDKIEASYRHYISVYNLHSMGYSSKFISSEKRQIWNIPVYIYTV